MVVATTFTTPGFAQLKDDDNPASGSGEMLHTGEPNTSDNVVGYELDDDTPSDGSAEKLDAIRDSQTSELPYDSDGEDGLADFQTDEDDDPQSGAAFSPYDDVDRPDVK